MRKYAVIGTGNMGGALARALRKKLPGENVILFNRTAEKAQRLADELGCVCAPSAAEAARSADYILLGVKPYMMQGVVDGIKDVLRPGHILVTMAPAHLRAGLRRPAVRSRRSTGETDALRAVLDKIHAALQTGKALSFYPVELTPEKQLRAAGGRMVVSPKGLVWDNERYALVAWDHRAQTTGVFYPDRMAQVQVTGLPAQGREINLRHWVDAPFGPDPDLRRRVRLRCRRELAGEILDRFGRDTALIPEEDGETFTFAAEAVVGPAFWGWLTALEGRAEVVAPPWAAKVWTERYRPAAQGGEGRPTKVG